MSRSLACVALLVNLFAPLPQGPKRGRLFRWVCMVGSTSSWALRDGPSGHVGGE